MSRRQKRTGRPLRCQGRREGLIADERPVVCGAAYLSGGALNDPPENFGLGTHFETPFREGYPAMTDRELMELAIGELEKCNPTDPERVPKVGAVVAIDGQVVAAASRGEEDHAEKRALAQIDAGRDLSRATVYTTLEPCTRGVRRKEGESCTDRLIRRQIHKVVIGILDPNQGVCGKGLLQLQGAKIEVELFPHALAQRIRQLNDTFIQAQQSLGMRITAPDTGANIRGRYYRVRGTFRNPPGDNVIAITNIGDQWWPQLSPIRVIPESDNEWEVDVNVGIACPHKLYIVKASDLGMELINYYRKICTF